jgi:hypothetical protein
MRGGPFEPTKQQRDMVEALVGYDVRYTEICRLVVNPRTGKPIDTKTLMKAFRSELDVGATKANAKVAESLFKQATSGNVTAQIWWTKCRMGWKEPPSAVELSGRVDSTLEVVNARERVTRKLNSLAERIAGRVAGLVPARGAAPVPEETER